MTSRLDALIAQLQEQTPRQVIDSARRQAAVALLLARDPDQVLLIRRSERAGDPWSGQRALPGGRRDPGDADLLETAIRETREETGVHLQRTDCLATLDDLSPSSPVLPPIIVRPFVFLLNAADPPTLSPEVAHAAWVPLAALAEEGVYRSRELEIAGASRVVSGYYLPEGFLWGMTERMLTPIVQRWKRLAPAP